MTVQLVTDDADGRYSPRYHPGGSTPHLGHSTNYLGGIGQPFGVTYNRADRCAMAPEWAHALSGYRALLVGESEFPVAGSASAAPVGGAQSVAFTELIMEWHPGTVTKCDGISPGANGPAYRTPD